MSAIPEAIDKIVVFMGTVGPTVHDGPPTTAEWPDEDSIVVGWNRDTAGIGIETTPAGFGALNQEVFTVTCLLSVISGDEELKPLRDRAFALYGTLSTKIRQDKTLGGAVAQARLSTADVTQILNTNGAAVEIAFDIECTAFI